MTPKEYNDLVDQIYKTMRRVEGVALTLGIVIVLLLRFFFKISSDTAILLGSVPIGIVLFIIWIPFDKKINRARKSVDQSQS